MATTSAVYEACQREQRAEKIIDIGLPGHGKVDVSVRGFGVLDEETINPEESLHKPKGASGV